MPALWWLIICVVLLVVEMVTPGLFFFACLAGGALLASVATYLGMGPTVAWAVFIVGSGVLVLIVAPLARRWMKRLPPSPVGLDALVGQRARVVQTIDAESGQGQVRLENGAIWRASSEVNIPEQSWVEVLQVVGARLQVRPISENPTSEV